MPVEENSVNEYETVVVGAGYLVKGILQRLGVAQAIDSALIHQPEFEATYGSLAQVIIVNRLSFQLQPLYQLADWAARHGMDQVFDINSAWGWTTTGWEPCWKPWRSSRLLSGAPRSTTGYGVSA